MRDRLHEGARCLYLNSPAMASIMRSYLSAAGVDVEGEIAKGSLIVSSDRTHLLGTRFDVDRILAMVDGAISQALNDGYRGLWASGDMTWELGPEPEFAKLLEYEWRLEELFLRRPALSGICQYHSDTLPKEALRHSLATHAALFVNETLSRINPYYTRAAKFKELPARDSELGAIVSQMCSVNSAS